MNLEFPETTYTTQYALLPTVNAGILSMTLANSTGFTTYAGDTLKGTGQTNQYLYKAWWFTNWYQISTGTNASKVADDCFQAIYIPTPPALTANVGGTPFYPLLPFYDVRTSKGEGVHDYSKLTETYYTYRTSTYAGVGDEINASGSTWVVVSTGTTTSDYRSIALKKA